MSSRSADAAAGWERAGKQILVVEDDQQLATLLDEQLRLAGYEVTLAPDLATARERVSGFDFALIVLDRNLPDGDGLELAEELTLDGRSPEPTAVLMLTAKADVDSRVAGLYAGASDYLTKPFSVQELLARIHVRLRDRGGGKGEPLRYGQLELDPENNSCRVGEEVLFLPEREFTVLHLLVRYHGRVITQDDLERAIYREELPESNTVEVFVYNLRRKLKGVGLDNVIRTVRNRGYIIV